MASISMQVIKRNGDREDVSFDKVLNRIQTAAAGLEVNPTLIAQRTLLRIHDGVKTSELDELAAQLSVSLMTTHPDYGTLAARLAITNHHQNTSDRFTDVVEALANQVIEKTGEHTSTVSQELIDLCRLHGDAINQKICHERDHLFDYFGFKTLEKLQYLLRDTKGKTLERPQYLLMRVSLALWGSISLERAFETYDLLSQKYFIHATPTNFNAGTPRQQLSSCFTENTLVHTLQGVKMIKDVAIGDQVVTHTGGVRPVVQLHKNLLADRPLFDIKLSGTPTMTVTGNHRLWSVSDEKEKWGMPAGWNTVEYLRVGDWVAIPNKKGGEAYVLDVKPFLDEYTSDGNNVSYRYDYSEPGRVTSYASWTKHFANERTVNSEKKGDSFNRYWVFDEDMMELMGIWYGDGCVFHGRRSDGGQSVRGINIVSFHNNHVLIDFVTAMLYEKLGVKHVTVRHDKNGMVTMSVNHHTIGHLFKAIFRSGFAGKRLPAFFHTLPKASITSFLAGIVSSDGCVTGTGSITVSLTNPPLVHDIFHLARSVGIPITMTLMHKKDAKATGRMTIPSDVVDGKIKKVYADNRIEIYESKKMWQQVRVIDGVTFMRINAKDHAQERPEYVYTLGVEEDHSYSVGGIVAENCFLISMKADSINGIYDTLKDCALISKYAGGIGLHIHNIRAKGSLIRGTNGTSNGIVPMLRNFNDTARYVDQCFTPDTLVTTETGPRPIADIKAGDRVLTHKGTYETVQKQVIHQYKGQMFAITLEDHDTPVRVTEEHPLLSLKAKGDSLETVLARVQMGVDAPDYLEVKELAVGDVTVFPQGPQGQKDQKSHGIITSIVPVEYDGPVYDFEVEGEHNYTVTHLGVAHNGGGKRNGSFAIYLEPWHADVEDFLKLKLNTGSEEERCRDLFYALWISDLFMERVETNSPWTRFCPSEAPGLADVYGDEFRTLYERYEAEGRGRKQIDAQKLWFKILDAQIETGTPYLLFKDAANQKSNQKNVGTIKSSNLCVAPETYLLTDQGQQQISTLVGQTVRVWNGEDWSETVVHKTGEQQKLITVFLSNGAQLTCTPYHKFLIRSGEYDKATIKDATRVEAKDLQPNMKLIKWNAPVLVGSSEFDFKEPYTHGFFCGDGNEFKNENKRIILCGEKKKLIPYLRLNTIGNEQKNGTIQAMIPKDLNKKFDVPLLASIECRVKWIAGLLDADAGVHRSNKNTDVIDLCGTEKEFLNNVRLLLLSLGVQSKVILAKKARTDVFPGGKEYHCKDLYHIPIGAESIYQLVTLGMVCHRLVFRHPEPTRSCQQYVTVTSVMDMGRVDDTYCVNEPHNHAAVFNGILTGNCTEIMEYSSPEETSVCNLASLALPAYVNVATKTFDYAMLRKVVKVAIRNLNRVIDINYYPTPETERSNFRHRPVGLGVQGLADVFALMRVSWESEKAADLNQRIFEHIYYAAVESSCEIAAEDGPYSTFHGSPMSEGMFQYDMWGVTPLTAQGAAEDQLDWAGLKERVMVTGVRNSLLVAPMPTASTSQILGFNECIEPFTSNLYARRTLAGEFVVINRHLMKDLQKLDLWNEMMKQQIIARNGSIQGLDQIPESIQRLYKTSWEIKQKTLIDMAAARGAFICQSQSMNLFVGDPNYAKLTSMHFYSWKKGLKTGIYYLRTRAPVMAQKFTVDPELQREAQRSEQMRLLRKSSDADSECVMCGS